MKAAWMLPLLIAGGLSNFSNAGLAQGKYDGIWSAKASPYEIRLTVNDDKARLLLKCGGAERAADLQVGSTGVFEVFVGSGLSRQMVTGQLPSLVVGPPGFSGGMCGSVTTTLTRPDLGFPLTAPAQAAIPAPVPLVSAPPVTPPTPQAPSAEEEARRKFVGSLNADDIRQIQTALASQGLYKTAIDGAWGPGTEGAIKAWQSKNGIPPTGVLSSVHVDTLKRSVIVATPQPQDTPSQSLAQPSTSSEADRERQLAERERQIEAREARVAEQQAAKEQAERERQIAEQKTAQQRADEEARQRVVAEKIEKDRQLDEREKQLTERERVLAEQERQLKSTAPRPASVDLRQLVIGKEPSGILDIAAISEAIKARYGSKLLEDLRIYQVNNSVDGMKATGMYAYGVACRPRTCSDEQARYVIEPDQIWIAIVRSDKLNVLGNPPNEVRQLLVSDGRSASTAVAAPPKPQRVEWNDLRGGWIDTQFTCDKQTADGNANAFLISNQSIKQFSPAGDDHSVTCIVSKVETTSPNAFRVFSSCPASQEAIANTPSLASNPKKLYPHVQNFSLTGDVLRVQYLERSRNGQYRVEADSKYRRCEFIK